MENQIKHGFIIYYVFHLVYTYGSVFVTLKQSSYFLHVYALFKLGTNKSDMQHSFLQQTCPF